VRACSAWGGRAMQALAWRQRRHGLAARGRVVPRVCMSLARALAWARSRARVRRGATVSGTACMSLARAGRANFARAGLADPGRLEHQLPDPDRLEQELPNPGPWSRAPTLATGHYRGWATPAFWRRTCPSRSSWWTCLRTSTNLRHSSSSSPSWPGPGFQRPPHHHFW
jgi:hypothetical protein